MAVKFFGQFLIEQNAITHSALLRAIELQEDTNLKIGKIGHEMGLMSQVQIAKVNQAQRNEDTRFGDKAVALGFLSAAQLQQALTKQKNTHIYLGEALVKTGGLKEADLKIYLNRFKEDQRPYMVDKIEIPAGVAHQPIWEMVADLTNKMLVRIASMSIRPGACQIIEELPARTLVAEIGFSGSVSARYLLTASPTTRKIIARAILQEDDIEGEPVEMLDDSVMEFINIVCGNIAAKAAQLGFQIDITPPKTHPPQMTGLAVPEKHTGLMFPIYLSDGEIFELAIFIRDE
ncbi:MAG: chemotaxis protein CheX [Geopsychrobacter sp.]|nr:chemotaxis protein CheX [Geopsychrobacter sp.]